LGLGSLHVFAPDVFDDGRGRPDDARCGVATLRDPRADTQPAERRMQNSTRARNARRRSATKPHDASQEPTMNRPRLGRGAGGLRAGRARSLMLAGLAALLGQAPARAADACTARSAPTIAPVIELYTSEGCNSCPPADRWLSALKGDPSVVALAFHVDYWDRLGWKDRFASPVFTARQATQQASNGARFSYTPQVVVDGRDRTDWSRAALLGARAAAPVDVSLAQRGDRIVATVTPAAGAPSRLAAYWAVTEQGHVSAVKAGENEGVTLHHDFVVRDYEPVAAWPARAGTAQTLSFRPAAPADPAHPRAVNLVVVDAGTGRPVQALKVGC
jgi:hypothetical protein